MKKSLLFGFSFLSILYSCEKIDHDVFFKIGSDLEYKFSDIELYDTSTHILYFKTVHDEFKDIENGTFTFLNNGDPIYTGSFWPGYSSSIPSGPFIMSPPYMYGNYALRIENWNFDNHDLRNDTRIIDILNQNNLLHSGLAISSSLIEITGTQLTFRFTVTNQDQSNLMIIDIEKTGPNLFHFFTNGLYIYDTAHNEVFSSNIEHQTPDPWNSWNIEWLSDLKAGESKEFTINYELNDPLIPGEYDTLFEFPGLSYQVTKDQLYQENSRIWLGDITINKRIVIQ
ncbi:MAG: hypothetical protein K0B37_16935 [Bacteroidales bacterium]|nr:hypothetical protein [Bacteroidales bacterium]